MVLMQGPKGNWQEFTNMPVKDIKEHVAFMVELNRELAASGELIASAGLAGREAAKIVTSDGAGAPVVTDGPFPEAKEFLAGYWIVDVASPGAASPWPSTHSPLAVRSWLSWCMKPMCAWKSSGDQSLTA